MKPSKLIFSAVIILPLCACAGFIRNSDGSVNWGQTITASNNKAVAVAQQIDQGVTAFDNSAIPDLCLIASGLAQLGSTSGNPNTVLNKAVSGAQAAANQPACTNPAAAPVGTAAQLLQAINAVKLATGNKVTATAAAKSSTSTP